MNLRHLQPVRREIEASLDSFEPEFYGQPNKPPAEGADLIAILWRRRALLTIMLILGAIGGLVAYKLQPRMYQSSASLELEPPNDNFLNMGNVSPTVSSTYPGDAYMQTQAQVLRSRSLLNKIADKLDFGRRTGLSNRTDALEMLSGNLKVEAAQGTRTIDVLYRSTDPKLAADVVNSLTEEYTQSNLDMRWDGAQKTANWLGQRLTELKTGLEKSEAELQSYSRSSGLLFTADKDNVAEQRLRQIQEELSRAQADAMQKQARAELMAAAQPEVLGEIVESDLLRSYNSKLAELRQERADLATLLTPANNKVKRVDNQIAELESMIRKERSDIARRIQADHQSAYRRERLLMREYESQQSRVSDLAAKAIRYNLLKREVESNRQLYESLLQKVKEAGVASAIRASNVRVIDPAIPASRPYRPRLLINLAAGLASGLFLAVGLAFVLERSNKTLRTPGEATSYLSIPGLGAIPRERSALYESAPAGGVGGTLVAAAKNAFGREPANGDNRLELATWRSKQSLFAESYRQVLASVLSSWKTAPPKVVVVTSANPAEGKTTAVCNLGIALARMEKRVLLVDADLRNPRLHQVFKLGFSPGLADAPHVHKGAKALCRSTDVPNLFVLTAGSGEERAFDLLSPEGMAGVLNELRAEFDTVLLDTPPLLLLADARILGRLADAAVIVVRAGKTDRESALRAVQRLQDDGVPLLGTILTDWQPEQSTVSYYRGYSGRATKS